MFPLAIGWFSLWQLMVPLSVLIDPGHGGTNYGACAVDGTWEKELTLDLALRLEKALIELSVRTDLTRRTDTAVSLWRRSEMARQLRPTCFVSLHFNASVLKNRSGLEIYYPREDRVLSADFLTHIRKEPNLLVGSYLAHMQQTAYARGSRNIARRLAWRLSADGFRVMQVTSATFDVLTTPDTRAILVEAGFLDHETEGKRVLEEEYRENLARRFAHHLAKLCTAAPEERVIN